MLKFNSCSRHTAAAGSFSVTGWVIIFYSKKKNGKRNDRESERDIRIK